MMEIKAINGWHDIHVRAKPVADLAYYELWASSGRNDRMRITPQQIRRAVIMRKQGETWADCGRAVGSTGGTLKQIVEFLPLHLQP